MTPVASDPAPTDAPPEREDVLDGLRLAFGELMGAERRLRGRNNEREGALSFAQMRGLFLLCDQADGVTAGRLAKLAELTPASVTSLLDHAEQEGIVERTRSEEDRRVVLVSLTDAGRALLDSKRGRWRASWGGALGDLPDEDLAAAARVMRRVAGMFDAF
ncbi:MAG: transcriptional regulator, MarR family [Conexibacter sp.]|jgi:DNA-binding MarR family transcriptional regulator|nr:transcriptional regulator, MarR family [Conexibacter sp.]